MAQLITTLGPKAEQDLGLILPHEHIFVDLRSLDSPGHGKADEAEVVALMAPELERAAAAGATALVECTPEGCRAPDRPGGGSLSSCRHAGCGTHGDLPGALGASLGTHRFRRAAALLDVGRAGGFYRRDGGTGRLGQIERRG